MSKQDFIKEFCKTNEIVSVSTKLEASGVAYGEIKEWMAFADDKREYYKVDFEGEFYSFAKKYKVDTTIFSTDDIKYLDNIITDKNGNLYINSSNLLFINKNS